MLSESELERYNRHIILPEIGVEGQEKLKNARVLIAGLGGLGCPISLYLAAAGVGTLGLVDYDRVSVSNLHRQILFTADDVGKSKAVVAEQHLKHLNPDLEFKSYNLRLSPENALQIISDYDIVADGSDNFSTKYLINDSCVLLGKANVYGSILRFEGQVSTYCPGRAYPYNHFPCYRCIFPEPPASEEVPSCEEAGVIGVLAGIIGSIQATEVIKLILGKGELLAGRLVILDALKMKFKEIKFERNTQCCVCGDNPTIRNISDYNYQFFCQTSVESPMQNEITVQELKKKMDNQENFVLLDVREPAEKQIADIGGILIPLNSLPYQLEKLNKEDEIIVYCRTGNRSNYAAEWLRKQGYTKAKNLTGGIHAWSDAIDSSVPKY